MAEKIRAITAYRPRIVAGATLQRKELMSFIARSTGLNEGEISLVLAELRDTVIHHNLQGRR